MAPPPQEVRAAGNLGRPRAVDLARRRVVTRRKLPPPRTRKSRGQVDSGRGREGRGGSGPAGAASGRYGGAAGARRPRGSGTRPGALREGRARGGRGAALRVPPPARGARQVSLARSAGGGVSARAAGRMAGGGPHRGRCARLPGAPRPERAGVLVFAERGDRAFLRDTRLVQPAGPPVTPLSRGSERASGWGGGVCTCSLHRRGGPD